MKKLGKVVLGSMVVLGLCACGKTEDNQVKEVVVSNEYVTVDIVADGKAVYEDLRVPVIGGEVISDVMDQVEQLYEVDFITEDSQYGLFLAGIEGIENEANEYWMVYENGEITDEGVSTEDVAGNDEITFSLESFE